MLCGHTGNVVFLPEKKMRFKAEAISEGLHSNTLQVMYFQGMNNSRNKNLYIFSDQRVYRGSHLINNQENNLNTLHRGQLSI